MPIRRILGPLPAGPTAIIDPPSRKRAVPTNDDHHVLPIRKTRRKSTRRGPPPDTYEVGDRKPPVHSRFKPGQSGNPSGYNGRQKRAAAMAEQKSIDDHVLEIFSEPVPVQTPNGPQKMNAIQIALRKLREKAVTGDQRAIRDMVLLFSNAQKHRTSDAGSPAASLPLTALDEEILAELMHELRAPTGDPALPHPPPTAPADPQADGSDDLLPEEEIR